MATLKNSRNKLIYESAVRGTGAVVSISSTPTSSILVPKASTSPVPTSITLKAYANGYITPSYVWSYRYGTDGNWVSLNKITSEITETLNSSWLTSAGTSTVIQYKVAVSETATGYTTGINSTEYIHSVPILREGADGVAGFNNATAYIYKRTSTNVAPTLDTSGNFTYNFNSGNIVGVPSGWAQSVPSANNGAYLWVSQAQVSSQAGSASFANTNWSSSVLYTQDGASGAPGATGTRGSRSIYDNNSFYSSNWTYLSNNPGKDSFSAKATDLIASLTSGSTPTTPIKGDQLTFSNTTVNTFTGSLSGFILTIASGNIVSPNTVSIGQTLTGAGILPGTTVTSFIGSSSGGAGQYGISLNHTTSVTGVSIVAKTGSFVYTLTFDGTSWNPPGTVVDGSLLVTGSITSDKIDTRGLTIRDYEGNVLFSSGNDYVPSDGAGGGSTSTTSSTNVVDDAIVINSDKTDSNVDLIFARTTGGNAMMRWNGTNLACDALFTPSKLGLSSMISNIAPSYTYPGLVWIDTSA